MALVAADSAEAAAVGAKKKIRKSTLIGCFLIRIIKNTPLAVCEGR